MWRGGEGSNTKQKTNESTGHLLGKVDCGDSVDSPLDSQKEGRIFATQCWPRGHHNNGLHLSLQSAVKTLSLYFSFYFLAYVLRVHCDIFKSAYNTS
jgi:hypothetical protein